MFTIMTVGGVFAQRFCDQHHPVQGFHRARRLDIPPFQLGWERRKHHHPCLPHECLPYLIQLLVLLLYTEIKSVIAKKMLY
jgi:hypothetical protein